MAYAALVSLSQTIHKLLQDQDRFPISPHEKQHIISLHERIIFLQAFLENFPTRGNILEGRIRDVAYEAEDIIEYFMWKQIFRRQSSTLKSISGLVSSKFSLLIGMCSDFKNLRGVTGEIECIARDVMGMMNSARSTDDDSCVDTGSSLSSSSRLIIGPPTSKDPSVGLEDDLMQIKGRLCGELSQLQVIPICGMGGIGKTTVAKNAYDDQLIVEHFHIRAWFTVSQDYSVLQILSSLLLSIGVEHSEESGKSKMDEQVYKSLKGKRYLIVMDDIWNKKAWEDVRRIFPNDHNGSRILLTTRLWDVAAYASSPSLIHRVHFMGEEQSWNLLRKQVFGQGNCPCELEDIGKRIAKCCRGLPLAIIVIAGLLSTMNQTSASWEYIARNVNKFVTTKEEQFVETALSLSYNHLPHHLRSCFLYMGIFPEDYEIRVSELMKLWVAEGFLKLPNGCESFEEVAEEYLEDLVKRSLVLVMKRKSNGKIKSCNVHDLVRDLCRRKAEQEKFLLHVDSKDVQENLRNQRRVGFAEFHAYFLDQICGPTSTIRSIMCFQHWWGYVPWLLISPRNLRLLRVFQIGCSRPLEPFPYVSRTLDDEVFELFHLRYLSIKVPFKIPAAISKLENLQTLMIDPRKSDQQGVAYFPLEIWRMPQLRHLVLSGCLPDPPEGETTFALENLQTLSVANFVCSKSTLEMIPNLKKLVIAYSEDFSHQDHDYHLENLVHLQHLKKLKLQGHAYSPFRGKLNLVFPRTLRKCTLNPVFPRTLRKCTLMQLGGFSWENIEIAIGSLPDLEVLKLKDFPSEYGNKWEENGDKWETREGEFLSLKFLLIEGTNLCHWITESSHFPRLESLVLHNCGHLNEIPDGIGKISTLELIEIYGRNQSLRDSARRIQEEQQSWGNDALQVRLRW